MNNKIAITIGDINGIGIKLLLKEWQNNKVKNFILITNYNIFKKKKFLPEYKINLIKNLKDDYTQNKFNIFNINTKNQYTNAFDSLSKAYTLTKQLKFIGILTLPINKNEINKYVNKKFIDQTTFFSKLENNSNSNMVLIYKKKYFVPLTIHIELKNVYKYFTKKKHIINKIISLNKTLKKDFKINFPKIAIAGINPHCGENGLISKDENKLINPLIKSLKLKGINIKGPFSGDSIINKNNLKKFDAFLFTFHDQALIPFKLLSNFEGINYTSNLNVIRLSPSHGTAKDLINKNLATSKGIVNCFKLIKKINNNRRLS